MGGSGMGDIVPAPSADCALYPPSPGTPGEGWGGGLKKLLASPLPNPPPEYREGGYGTFSSLRSGANVLRQLPDQRRGFDLLEFVAIGHCLAMQEKRAGMLG